MPEWLIGLVCKTNDFVLVGSNPTLNSKKKYASVVQLVEHWSPKPVVGGSSPSRRAKVDWGSP